MKNRLSFRTKKVTRQRSWNVDLHDAPFKIGTNFHLCPNRLFSFFLSRQDSSLLLRKTLLYAVWLHCFAIGNLNLSNHANLTSFNWADTRHGTYDRELGWTSFFDAYYNSSQFFREKSLYAQSQKFQQGTHKVLCFRKYWSETCCLMMDNNYRRKLTCTVVQIWNLIWTVKAE